MVFSVLEFFFYGFALVQFFFSFFVEPDFDFCEFIPVCYGVAVFIYVGCFFKIEMVVDVGDGSFE